MHFNPLHKISFPYIHRHKREGSRSEKNRISPDAEVMEALSVPADPFTPRTLPPTSIANLVMDPNNLTALYRAKAADSDAPVPVTESDSSVVNADSPSTASESNLSTPTTPHHPVQSIADMVLNPTTLSALYEARDLEGKSSVSKSLSRTEL
ncbi:hypothetical protein BT96DRAFT_1002008 [Gymnopus androsaceus JB14]|uniref:Uncharacterized protein n=1 Tax=Gymnopus androsaceus JB14 TaxID=1447944 RepID=A0A6A4GYA0_9AGAR|nr:hypothetical protein BT96DRAFT_1002008 [Gymnopus androsaceus JB14]